MVEKINDDLPPAKVSPGVVVDRVLRVDGQFVPDWRGASARRAPWRLAWRLARRQPDLPVLSPREKSAPMEL